MDGPQPHVGGQAEHRVRAELGRDVQPQQRVGERDNRQRDKAGLANYDNGRKATKQSKRGNKSLQGGAPSVKKQKRSGDGGAAVQARKAKGGHAGAFSGSKGGGQKAGVHKARGQKNLGGAGSPKRKRR